MNNEIVDKALNALQDAKGLPAVERNVTSILQSISAGASGHPQLVAHIVDDVALTQKVLKLANSPMYAPFAKTADSVSAALDVLGTDGLIHVALGTRMVSDNELAEDDSLSQSLLAAEFARSACPDRIEDASVAALMYGLGRLVLKRYLPEESDRIDQHIANGSDMDTAAQDVLGMTLQVFGSAIAKRWNLPADIVSIIDGSGDPALINVAKFSTTVSSMIHEGRADTAKKLVSDISLPGIDKEQLLGLVQRKHEAVRIKPALPTQSLSVSSAAALHDLLDSIRNERKTNVDELAAALIPTLSRMLNMAHCLLFMAMKSGDFSIHYGFGKGIDELRSKLRISAEFKPTAFHAAIKNNVDVSITDVLKLRSNGLPDGYQQLLPLVTRFFVLPIATNQVTGLLYCDWEIQGELHQEEIAALCQLRDLFLPFFPR